MGHYGKSKCWLKTTCEGRRAVIHLRPQHFLLINNINMTNQPNQPVKKEIKIADNIPGAEYANAMQINHNKDEFHMMYLNILGPSGRVSSKIITSPGHFKRMISAMQENLKKYEDQFGEIEVASAPENKEIGFAAK